MWGLYVAACQLLHLSCGTISPSHRISLCSVMSGLEWRSNSGRSDWYSKKTKQRVQLVWPSRDRVTARSQFDLRIRAWGGKIPAVGRSAAAGLATSQYGPATEPERTNQKRVLGWKWHSLDCLMQIFNLSIFFVIDHHNARISGTKNPSRWQFQPAWVSNMIYWTEIVFFQIQCTLTQGIYQTKNSKFLLRNIFDYKPNVPWKIIM